jgi:hypothetical protein
MVPLYYCVLVFLRKCDKRGGRFLQKGGFSLPGPILPTRCVCGTVAVYVIDTMSMYQLIYTSAQTRCPELGYLVLSTAPKILEYLNTKIRLSTPGLSALSTPVGQMYMPFYCVWCMPRHAWRNPHIDATTARGWRRRATTGTPPTHRPLEKLRVLYFPKYFAVLEMVMGRALGRLVLCTRLPCPSACP